MRPRLTSKETAFLARARVCRVGSVDRAGVVHVAPLCHAFDRERRIAYVATGGVTAENLRERRRASLECDDYFEDWDRLRGLVAHVRAKVVDRGAELDRARRLLKRKFAQYRETEFDSVIALHVEAVTSWGL
ncbi:MAG TPA: pyridoxamine 5'-phosphate oxidase family protein [Candidatus Saccharimonadales bacterium]|jgi:nitroimidazol reductase NimA-like FMN-containing flavoprotein (pyridoxamine 5'-phosphate oxidase superfamily)|nr:pyridoxamine 5'-phosphate oxidase family protein [Candidatus Saccharimonadales bacterium]